MQTTDLGENVRQANHSMAENPEFGPSVLLLRLAHAARSRCYVVTRQRVALSSSLFVSPLCDPCEEAIENVGIETQDCKNTGTSCVCVARRNIINVVRECVRAVLKKCALITRNTTALYEAVLRNIVIESQIQSTQVIADFEEAPAVALRNVYAVGSIMPMQAGRPSYQAPTCMQTGTH